MDASGVSGFDSEADARSMALLDFDHDGALDLAVANNNFPFFQLFHNRVQGKFVAVRLVGGNQSARPSKWSNRDGVGAVVKLTTPQRTLALTRRAGEGLGGQNSSTLLFGMEVEAAESLTVQWPSGRSQSVDSVLSGSLVIFDEQQGVTVTSYGSTALPQLGAPYRLPDFQADRPTLFVMMATWCEDCKEELPTLTQLKAALKERVDFLGVSADPNETPDQLEEFARNNTLPYRMDPGLPAPTVKALRDAVRRLAGETVPAWVLVDSDGTVLSVGPGEPTLSQIRRWTAQGPDPRTRELSLPEPAPLEPVRENFLRHKDELLAELAQKTPPDLSLSGESLYRAMQPFGLVKVTQQDGSVVVEPSKKTGSVRLGPFSPLAAEIEMQVEGPGQLEVVYETEGVSRTSQFSIDVGANQIKLALPTGLSHPVVNLKSAGPYKLNALRTR